MTTELIEATGKSSIITSLNTLFGMSAMYSNSRFSVASRSAARKGKKSSSYTYSKATLYSTQILWDQIESYKDDFITAIMDLNVSTSNNRINEKKKKKKKKKKIFFG
eukprot:356637_1